jgi:hypothetical protein
MALFDFTFSLRFGQKSGSSPKQLTFSTMFPDHVFEGHGEYTWKLITQNVTTPLRFQGFLCPWVFSRPCPNQVHRSSLPPLASSVCHLLPPRCATCPLGAPCATSHPPHQCTGRSESPRAMTRRPPCSLPHQSTVSQPQEQEATITKNYWKLKNKMEKEEKTNSENHQHNWN